MNPLKMKLALLSIIILSLITTANSESTTKKRKLKILLNSPTIGWSHMQYQGKIADTLVEAGHEVHMLVMNMNPVNGDYKSSALAQKYIRVDRKPTKKNDMSDMGIVMSPFKGYTNMMFDGSMEQFTGVFDECCQELLDNTALLKQLKAEKYDVGISEVFDMCAFGLFHHLGIETKLADYAITLVGTGGDSFGIPSFSSYVTNMWDPAMSGPHMSFLERAINFYSDLYEQYKIKPVITRNLQPMFNAAFGKDFPLLTNIMKNVSLIFVNYNPLYALPRPISSKVIYIGGIVESKRGPLSEEIQPIFDNTKSGVVFFSFGTFADSSLLPENIRRAFFSAFAKFPTYDFIWKLDVNVNDTEALSRAPNVHTFKWTDQKAILAHPKTRAFITHCGGNSMSEATSNGVPTVGIPLLGDQPYNAVLMHHKRIGVSLDILKVHQEEVIVEALGKVLSDPSYRANAKKLQRKLELSPFSPKEKLVKWVEFAAEFPELNELNLPSMDEMGYLVYHSMDVMLVSLLVLGVTAMISKWLVNWMWTKIEGVLMRNYEGVIKKYN